MLCETQNQEWGSEFETKLSKSEIEDILHETDNQLFDLFGTLFPFSYYSEIDLISIKSDNKEMLIILKLIIK